MVWTAYGGVLQAGGLVSRRAAAGEDRLEFKRDGKSESIRAGTGKKTRMKWLLEKTDCLIIKEREGILPVNILTVNLLFSTFVFWVAARIYVCRNSRN